MGKSFDPIGPAVGMRDAKRCGSASSLIVSTSFQLAIPWRVALPQSPLPLHQPGAIMHERAAAGHQKPANGQLCLNYLSHPRGQVQFSIGDLKRSSPEPAQLPTPEASPPSPETDQAEDQDEEEPLEDKFREDVPGEDGNSSG